MNLDVIKNNDEIIDGFPFDGRLTEVEKTSSGLINDTFILTFSNENIRRKYVLQHINTNVFRNPDELMSNIIGVSVFLKNKISLHGGDPERETLSFLYTRDNLPYFRASDGSCWRSYGYIGNSYTCDKVDSPVMAKRAGQAFARFQTLLNDFRAENLFETIPDFHNTPKRFEALKTAVERNASGRLGDVGEQLDFALSREGDAGVVTELLKSGELPLRVIHNDTKISNVLFDKITNEALCVIDLDTVMPGSLLYDFGDSIRSGAVTSDENETDFSKYGLDLSLYSSYCEGFVGACAGILTEKEAELLPFSVKLMALECGIRFLADYLDGDVYFKTDDPSRNLVRCINQFTLVRDVERNYEEMKRYTAEIYRRALIGD